MLRTSRLLGTRLTRGAAATWAPPSPGLAAASSWAFSAGAYSHRRWCTASSSSSGQPPPTDGSDTAAATSSGGDHTPGADGTTPAGITSGLPHRKTRAGKRLQRLASEEVDKARRGDVDPEAPDSDGGGGRSTLLARQWRETSTAAAHGRRAPAISKALELIQRQRGSLPQGARAAQHHAKSQQNKSQHDAAKPEHGKEETAAGAETPAEASKPAVAAAATTSPDKHDAAIAEAIADLLEQQQSEAAGTGEQQQQHKRMYGGLKAFRDTLSRSQVSEALNQAVGDATANGGQSHDATTHERHRRHLLSHVDIRFALRTLRIHVYKLTNGTEWIDVYLGPNAGDALLRPEEQQKKRATSSSTSDSNDPLAEDDPSLEAEEDLSERKRKAPQRMPTDDELTDVYHAAIAVLLQEHHVHDTLIEDAMERVLMPQAVLLPECCALILRCVRPDCESNADSLQQLTHRLTVFLFREKIITLHRHDLSSVRSVRRRFDERFKHSTQAHLLNALVYGCLQSFRKELARATVEFDALESRLFEPQETRSRLARDMYIIKRRAAVCARVVTMSAEAYSHAAGFLRVGPLDGYYQDVIHEFQQVKTTCEELNDSAHNVMQLLFQLSSYQLNELMRVLTMFSAFFIPLTFIAGVYGMNFEYMPLVKDEHGALYCTIVMAMVGATVLLWFRLRGF